MLESLHELRLKRAVARREEITPDLLRILKGTVDRAAQLDAEGDYMAHLYAMFLLAQFSETRAYAFALLPGDLLDSLCRDFMEISARYWRRYLAASWQGSSP